jgi:hypothetical protein
MASFAVQAHRASPFLLSALDADQGVLVVGT